MKYHEHEGHLDPRHHRLSHAEEVEGGHHSHMHHKKMHDHHLKEARKHADHMMKAMKMQHKKHAKKA